VRLPFCVACGAEQDLENRHLVHKAKGGGDEPGNLVTHSHAVPPYRFQKNLGSVETSPKLVVDPAR
jgi:hypothetical protein